MAIVSSFTHDGAVLVPPSQLVTFTDTSTGSPTHWHWDFGDGEISNLQHPTHTFVGESPDAFDVKLRAWKQASESGVTMGGISGTAQCTNKVVIASEDAPAAEALFDASGYGTLSSTRRLSGNIINTFSDPPGRREIHGVRTQWSQTPTSDPLKIPTIKVPLITGDSWYNRFCGGEGGTLILKRSDPGTWPGSFATIASTDAAGLGRTVIFDLSAYRGISSWFMITSTELVNANKDEGVSTFVGWWGSPVDLIDQNILSGDEDESTQELIFGTAPIAAFDADPKQGPTSVEVQFENLSTLAVGLPTTWSWKRKLHGSEDPFVEFSTEENPIETFNK